MKLNDLKTNLPKQVNLLNKQKIIAWVKTSLKDKTLEDFRNDKKELNISKKIEIEVSKNKTKIFDSLINNKFKQTIDLPKIILNQNIFFAKLKRFFKNPPKIDAKNVSLKNFDFQSFIKSFDTKKITIIFVLFFIFIISDVYTVRYFTKEAIADIKTIKQENIEENLKSAKYNLLFANIFFSPFSIIPNNDLQNINHLLRAWFSSSKIILDIFKLQKDVDFSKIDVSMFLSENKQNLEIISDKINYITKHINKIELNKQDPNYTKLKEIKNLSIKVNNSLNLINTDFPSFLELIWHNKTKKYLITFQNNDEIRATWWFMWSVWILSIFRWKISSFEKQDIYALEWEINKNYKDKITPPEPINNLTTSFWLRDSNNYVDFRESAKAMNYFLKMWNYNFDWVVFINMSSVENILEKIWYIDFEEINTIITSSNFAEIMSILVEAKTHKNWTLWTPKQVLFDFALALEEKIKNDKINIVKLAEIILWEIKNREIVAVAFNPKENDILKSFWVAGDVDYTKTLDFVYPIFISIWWNKSDRYIKRTFEKQIETEANCDIKTNLSIELEHNYKQEDRQRIIDTMTRYGVEQTNDLINIQWAGTNKTFTKLILPKDISIKNDESIKIEKLENATIVSYYTSINPWEKSSKNIEYTLKNPKCDSYDFEIYKQAGIRKYNLKIIENKTIKDFENISSDFYYKTWK